MRAGRLQLSLRVLLVAATAGVLFPLARVVPGTASVVPWGTVLVPGTLWAGSYGTAGDVSVYSNGNGNQDQATTYGLAYECVELAQRWMSLRYGEQHVWPIAFAYQMFDAAPSLTVPLSQIPNGASSPPQMGDLVIFDRSSASSTGHVAVVANTGPGYVTVVEQNWDNSNPVGRVQLPLSGNYMPPRSGLPVRGWLRGPSSYNPPPLLSHIILDSSTGAPPAGLTPGDPATRPTMLKRPLSARTPITPPDPPSSPTSSTTSTSSPPAPPTTPPGPPPAEVLGFIQPGEVASGAWSSDLHLDRLTTVVYSGLNLGPDGSLNTGDAGYSVWRSGQMTSLINAAHTAGVRVLLSAKAYNDGLIHSLTDSGPVRQGLAQVLEQEVAARGADGADIDFEGVDATTAAGLVALTGDLQFALRSSIPWQSMLVIESYATAAIGGTMFDVAGLHPYVDAFDVMAYDASTEASRNALPVAPLRGDPGAVTEAVTAYLAKVPAGQLILGVPYYGYKWSTNGNGARALVRCCANVDTYNNVLDDLACAPNPSINFDATAQEPWAWWDSPASSDPCGGNYNSFRELYFENARSLGCKYDVVNARGLAGIGIWALGYDSGHQELWDEISQKLGTPRGAAGNCDAPPPAAATSGYWMVAADGGIFAFGTAHFYGSMGGQRLNSAMLTMTPTATQHGYWLVAADGGIFSFGDAQFHGSTGNLHLNQPVVSMAPTPAGGGYWLVASDGGIFSFGDAHFYGSMGGSPLNQPIVGMLPTPSGHGYWMVASDGGIFAFGDAPFYGSTGNLHLNSPIVAMAATRSGHGYWMVAADGGIFSFGDAHFYGSMGGHALVRPVVGMTATSSGAGYWMVASDGGIFAFGDALFHGSMGGQQLNSPIVGIAAAG
jgi:hypothetical protein